MIPYRNSYNFCWLIDLLSKRLQSMVRRKTFKFFNKYIDQWSDWNIHLFIAVYFCIKYKPNLYIAKTQLTVRAVQMVLDGKSWSILTQHTNLRPARSIEFIFVCLIDVLPYGNKILMMLLYIDIILDFRGWQLLCTTILVVL